MTQPDDTTCEQLSAWMDGALPAEEARFLERRLEHDVELRAKWERMQLASACLRGHDVRPLPGLATRVAAALEATPAASAGRPWLRWAMAASVAVLAIALVPRMFPASTPDQVVVQPAPPPAATPEPVVSGPTPGSADLIAETVRAAPMVAVAPAPASPSPAAVDGGIADAGTAVSPEEFPLAERSTSWPRAGLPGADPSMEGYLVRHNELAGGDALGGFVPYLDVVAADDSGAAPEAPAAPAPAAQDDPR